MLLLIKRLQNTLQNLKISNTYYSILKYCRKVLINKFILPQFAPPPNIILDAALVSRKISITLSFSATNFY